MDLVGISDFDENEVLLMIDDGSDCEDEGEKQGSAENSALEGEHSKLSENTPTPLRLFRVPPELSNLKLTPYFAIAVNSSPTAVLQQKLSWAAAW